MKEWKSKRWCDFSKVTQLISDRTGIYTHVCFTTNQAHFTSPSLSICCLFEVCRCHTHSLCSSTELSRLRLMLHLFPQIQSPPWMPSPHPWIITQRLIFYTWKRGNKSICKCLAALRALSNCQCIFVKARACWARGRQPLPVLKK